LAKSDRAIFLLFLFVAGLDIKVIETFLVWSANYAGERSDITLSLFFSSFQMWELKRTNDLGLKSNWEILIGNFFVTGYLECWWID
jgi:hypothetical protein